MNRSILLALLEAAGVERGYVGGERFREHVADYILPRVNSLLAEVWDEGHAAGLGDMLRHHSCVLRQDALAATENPYR